MLNLKRIILVGAIFAALPVMLMAQARPGVTSGNPEMTVEQSYLQESIELMIIREQSRAESRDMKLVALEYIGDAINRGNKGDEVRAALEYLSLEGVVNITRENGRVVNNYPDVRTRAATYLGQLGTPEAKNALIKMVSADNEPMVLTEAIKSLGNLGINDNNDTINTIVWTVNRFNNLNPDNLLALSAIDAFEKLITAGRGSQDPNVIQILVKIAEGPYIRPVQDRAKAALSRLRGLNQ
ncbi:MAG: HEAT repeat domain-containing protein [Treponema sp.]|nr:HEAT repeat domain-containing protein [Treponema sp.]